MSIISRFEGSSGRRKVMSLLLINSIVNGEKEVAKALQNVGVLLDFHTDKYLIRQGGEDDDIYFLISGETKIIVNGRIVAKRSSPDHVGEMSLLNHSAERSADVQALTPTVALKVSESNFNDIAENHPVIWKNIALGLSDRLKEREKYWKTPNYLPQVFIGAISRDLPTAKDLLVSFQDYQIETHLWSSDTLKKDSILMDSLNQLSHDKDFAIFILLGDHLFERKGESRVLLSENLIFEIGMFVGKLGKKRVCLVSSKQLWPRVILPSDLKGIQKYLFNHMNTDGSLEAVCHQIAKRITELGPV